jgi:lysophospholipase L1-like esterase
MRRLFSLLVLAVAATPALADDFFFKPNDRVVFLGDSITEQYQYSTYLELYLTTRFPKANFVFLNAGIGGDTANGGAGRFQAHILDEKPTAVTINFGMNDGGYQEFKERENKVYREKTEAMLKMAKAAGVRVALCSPNSVDPRVSPNWSDFKRYQETQREFYAPLKEIAAKNGAAFADQYAVTRKAIEAMTKDDPKAERAKPYYDGFHTSPPGGMLMAWAILTELKAPAMVSHVGLSVGSGVKEVGCKVTDLKSSDTAVSFTRTDDALPLPVQKDWRPMLPYTNELKDLNRYELLVTGLKEGKYDIAIDGTTVATHTAKVLAAGVNLGNAASGPVFDHAQKVFDAINAKNNIVRSRFFEIHRASPPPAWVKLATPYPEQKKEELAKRLARIEEAQKKVNDLAQPKPHKWEITAAK